MNLKLSQKEEGKKSLNMHLSLSFFFYVHTYTQYRNARARIKRCALISDMLFSVTIRLRI